MIPRIVLRQRFYLTLLQRLQHSVVTNLDDARVWAMRRHKAWPGHSTDDR